MKKEQRCSRCVMDNSSDDSITFDSNGICNYCTYALERMPNVYFPNVLGKNKLKEMISQVKENSKNKKYDCIMGISGGLDSAYLLYLGHKWGLRILAFHIDDGFNNEIATHNIKELCKKTNTELIIEKPNKEQFNDITKAFMLAGLPGICVPQDNIILSYLYKNARKYNINYFLSGANFALESILQRGETTNASDGFHIKEISKQFGVKGVDKLPLVSLFQRYVMIKYTYNLNVLRPLDLIDYNRNQALKELSDFSDFRYYGGKHYENLLTHFAQAYYLPNKFNVDKRTSHLSSLIISNQLSRTEALEELEKPLYNKEEMEKKIEFILSNLELSRSDFDQIMLAFPRQHSDYRQSFFINFAQLARKYRSFLSN